MQDTLQAELIRHLPDAEWYGDVRLYRLSRPASVERSDGDVLHSHYVVVSAATLPNGAEETMVFLAGPDGHVLSWLDLAVVHTLDHDAALAALRF